MSAIQSLSSPVAARPVQPPPAATQPVTRDRDRDGDVDKAKAVDQDKGQILDLQA